MNKSQTQIEKEPMSTLVVLACWSLGGMKKKVHTEEMVMQVFKWAPEKVQWSMEIYKEFPDKERVRRELLQARNETKYITGAKSDNLEKDGWYLTEKGIKFCEENEKLIPRKNKEITNKELSKEDKDRLKEFFTKTQTMNLEKPSSFNIFKLFRIFNVNSGNLNLLRKKFYRYKNLAILSNYTELIEWLDAVVKYPDFSEYLDEKKFQNQHLIHGKKKRKYQNE